MKDKRIIINAGCEKCRYCKMLEKIERIITVLWDVVRKFIRILAVPFLFLFWVALLMQAVLWVTLCIFDFKPRGWRIVLYNFCDLLRCYFIEGIMGVWYETTIERKIQ